MPGEASPSRLEYLREHDRDHLGCGRAGDRRRPRRGGAADRPEPVGGLARRPRPVAPDVEEPALTFWLGLSSRQSDPDGVAASVTPTARAHVIDAGVYGV